MSDNQSSILPIIQAIDLADRETQIYVTLHADSVEYNYAEPVKGIRSYVIFIDILDGEVVPSLYWIKEA